MNSQQMQALHVIKLSHRLPCEKEVKDMFCVKDKAWMCYFCEQVWHIGCLWYAYKCSSI
jgi:hypothetical protein